MSVESRWLRNCCRRVRTGCRSVGGRSGIMSDDRPHWHPHLHANFCKHEPRTRRHVTAAYLLVANPSAQSGRNAARIERALQLLEAAGIPAAVLATQPEGRTIGLVREALDAGHP